MPVWGPERVGLHGLAGSLALGMAALASHLLGMGLVLATMIAAELFRRSNLARTPVMSAFHGVSSFQAVGSASTLGLRVSNGSYDAAISGRWAEFDPVWGDGSFRG